MGSSKVLFFFLFTLAAVVSADQENEEDPGLLVDFYKNTCPQAEEVIRDEVRLLYKRHKNTAFSWLRNIFHDCAVQVMTAHRLLKFRKTPDSLTDVRCCCLMYVSTVMRRVPAAGLNKEGAVRERDRSKLRHEKLQVG